MPSRNRFLLFALLLASAVAAFAESSSETMPFRLYRGYLVVVHGSAGPFKDLNLLLDTGTNPTMLDLRLASKLNLERVPADVRVVGGNVHAERAVVPKLTIGPVEKADVPVFVADLSFFQDAIPVPIDGVIGLDTLANRTFLIDYETRQIHFGALPALHYSISIQQPGGLAVISAEVNNIPRRLLVDTGASSLTLFAPSANQARSVKVSQPIGSFIHKDVILHHLKVGSTDFGPKQASIVTGDWQGYTFDGLVSPAMLGMRRVCFDLSRGVMSFSL